MKHDEFSQGRILRSAKAIKAYFEQKLKMPLEFLEAAPAKVGREDVQFSTSMSGFGLWGVRATEPLGSAEHSEIYETFHSILESMQNLERRRSDLARMEENLTLETPPANVIPFRRRRLATAEAADFVRAGDKRWVLRLDCLIEAQYISEIHKMALELHSHSQRYAFVEFRDLDPVKRTSLNELTMMGAITLFVPDLLQLSTPEQEALRQLIASESALRPLLMVGTTLPFAELRRVAGVHLDFLTELSRAYIKLTRPFTEYKDQGLIHYFLDSLSENPS